MGWSIYAKPQNVKAHLDGEMNSNIKVLASALKGFTYYEALQLPDATVTATVALVRYYRDGTIGVKWMDEDMGPNESDCPEKILDLLTPTTREYATAWRERCRLNLGRRAAVKVLQCGDIVALTRPMHFNNGGDYQTFKILEKHPTYLLASPVGSPLTVRISRKGLIAALVNRQLFVGRV